YKEERLLQFYEQLFARFDEMPGSRAATFGSVPLIAHYMWNTDILLPGETEKTAAEHLSNRQVVRENYFATLEISLLRGRGFSAQDAATSPKVGIVNQEFGKRFFADEDPIGKRVRESDSKDEIEIIGVVADTKYNSQREGIEPLLYTMWRQETASIGQMYFSLRAASEPTSLVEGVRAAVRDMDSDIPITELTTQEARSEQSLAQERLYARLLSFFSALALLLAAIGLSGVLAYAVAQRTQEIGVRMALGARSANVLRLVIWQGMKLVLVGLAVGAACAYGLKRLFDSQYFSEEAWQREMASRLYGVSGTDPLTIAVIAVLLAVVALAACWMPARRASRVDPLDALRHE
ncbi:MAG: FtsX-like permease family protein, partial [Acidobacteriota bacterium]